MYELANSETTLALAWVPNSPSCLAAGTGVKWLRIYDLRGTTNKQKIQAIIFYLVLLLPILIMLVLMVN